MPKLIVKNKVAVPVLRSDEKKYITYDVVNNKATKSTITEFKLPKNVNDVDNYALYGLHYNNSKLKTVNLSSLENISGAYALGSAFQSCASLESADLSNLESITGQYGLQSAFYGSTIESVDLGNLSVIGYYGLQSAFYNCQRLTSIDLSALTSIGQYGLNDTFYQCYNLLSADLSALTSIDNYSLCGTFYGCNKLKEINFSNLTTLPKNNNCHSLYWTFPYCTSLEKVYFPKLTGNNIIINGYDEYSNPLYYCFYECRNLKELHFHYSMEKYKNYLTRDTLFGGSSSSYSHPDLQILYDFGVVYQNLIINVNDYILYCNDILTTSPFMTIPGKDNEYVIYKDGYCLYIGHITPSVEDENLTKDLNVTMVQSGDTYSVTTDISTTITFKYGNVVLKTVEGTSASIIVPEGTEISYTASAPHYSQEHGILSSSNKTVSLTMQESSYQTFDMTYPFSDSSYQSYLTNLIDGHNFIVHSGEGNMQPSIVNGDYSYNLDDGESYGWIEFTTPNENNTELLTVSVTAAGTSESGCDIGWIYIDTNKTDPNNVSSSNILYNTDNYQSETYTTHTKVLQPNTKYYLQFKYIKDGSVDEGWDRMSISNIKFTVQV